MESGQEPSAGSPQGEGYYNEQSAIEEHALQQEGQESTSIDPDWINGGHLVGFLCHLDMTVGNLLVQMDLGYHKFWEILNRIYVQGYHLAFLARTDHLYKFRTEVLDVEVRNIWEELVTLHKFHQTVISACSTKVQTEVKIELHDLEVVRRSAAKLIDRILIFQSNMYDTFTKPLGWIELDLQGMAMAHMMRAANDMNPYKTSYWQPPNFPPSTLPVAPSSTAGCKFTTGTASTPGVLMMPETASGLPYGGEFVENKGAGC